MLDLTTKPPRGETNDYYFTYIDKVPDGDIRDTLAAQLEPTLDLFRAITEERSQHRYGPGKWSIRDVLGHLNDAERLFVFRAFWFARGLDAPLPSFEQDAAVAAARADARTWADLVTEFETIRKATLTFFRSLPADAWERRGIASDFPFTVRALAFIVAGHLAHHVQILRERYLGV